MNRSFALIAFAAIATLSAGLAWAVGYPLDLVGSVGTLMLANAPLALPEVKALAEEFKVTQTRLAAFFKEYGEKLPNDLHELKQRMLDLEQKGSSRAFGLNLGEPVGLGGMIKRLTDLGEFKAILRGGRGNARIQAEPGEGFETKTALITPPASGGGATALTEPQRGAMVVPAMRRLTVRGLLATVPTIYGSVDFPKETSFVNNAGPQFNSPSDRENVEKNESALNFSLTNVAMSTIAHWIPASRQVLGDSPALQGYVEGRLQYGLALEEEDELLNGDGTGGHISGLIVNATAYNRSVSNDTMLDTVRKACTQLQLAEYVPTGLVVNPADAEWLDLLKDTQGRYLLDVPLIAGGQPAIWRVPTVVTNSMTETKFLLGDFPMAGQIWDRQESAIEISTSHSDFFTKNMVAILCEERIALTVYRPSALIYGTLPRS